MKREIKFRAWSGNMFLDFGDANIYSPNRDSTEFEIKAGVSHGDYVLQQYTGLKDKNGKEIYEGDIIKVSKGHNYLGDGSDDTLVVAWRCDDTDNGWSLILPETEEYEEEISENVSLSENDIEEYGLKVIGNIYENPELIKFNE